MLWGTAVLKPCHWRDSSDVCFFLKVLVSSFAALLISGCALSPGSHIAGSSQSEGGAAALPAVNRHQITPQLVSDSTRTRVPDTAYAELMEQDTNQDYRVGPGDVLNITVWGHPELTIPAGSMRTPAESGNWIHSDGTIFYPYVGRVDVAGLPVMEIRELITKRISRYIEDPQVDVTVAAFRSQRVYVGGAVNQPGFYPVTNIPMYLLDAINLSGGISEHADWGNLALIRDGEEYPLSLRAVYQHGDMRHNVRLRDGDVLHVPRIDDRKVFLLGEVRSPGALTIGRNGLSLAEALAKVGGIDELSANATGVFVMRRASDGESIDLFQLDARDTTALVLADGFDMAARDIIYVTAAPVVRWNRVLRQILPTVDAFYLGVRADRELDRR